MGLVFSLWGTDPVCATTSPPVLCVRCKTRPRLYITMQSAPSPLCAWCIYGGSADPEEPWKMAPPSAICVPSAETSWETP